MREILVPKGERARVLYIWSSSMPGSIRFTAKTRSGAPSAEVVETSIRRLFTAKTTEYPLQAENTLQKGMFDASYQIYVTPNEDTTLRFQSRHLQAHHLKWAFVALIGLAALSALIPFVIRAL